MEEIVIVGYSGHSFVVLDSLHRLGRPVLGYFELNEKAANPFELRYLGPDTAGNLEELNPGVSVFVAIGDNAIRRRAIENARPHRPLATIVDRDAYVSAQANIGAATYIARAASVGPLANIDEGVIINTAAIVEHECHIGAGAHVAPGAVLAGNVRVGADSFIGANSVVREGINIGVGATIGAGAVVVADVPNQTTVVGSPARLLK